VVCMGERHTSGVQGRATHEWCARGSDTRVVCNHCWIALTWGLAKSILCKEGLQKLQLKKAKELATASEPDSSNGMCSLAGSHAL
jgi:hypothetical protein